MRVLVTGSTGLIGSHLCRELLQAGHEVMSLSRSGPGDAGGVWHLQADVNSGEARTFAAKAQTIVHLAGLSDASLSFHRPVEYATANAQGALNMLEAARAQGAHFVLASSQRVYRPGPLALSEDSPLGPVDAYGYSKLVAEMWCDMYQRVYAIPVTILRFFSVYGPGQRLSGGTSGVVNIFVGRALAGLDLVARQNVLRDFTYVSDVTGALREVIEHPKHGIFNIATGVATSVVDLAHLVKEMAGGAGEVIEEAGDDAVSYVADISKARRVLGYEPQVSLREGLQRYVRWAKQTT